MKLLSFPFAIIALSTVALSVGCGLLSGLDGDPDWLGQDTGPDQDTGGLSISHPGGGEMILIRAGIFEMGCTTAQGADGNCDSDESPVHSVTLTHDFYIGETEVTQGEYQLIKDTNPSFFKNCGPECPIEEITWDQAAKYANALSVEEGLEKCFSCSNGSCLIADPYSCEGYRLPTEAEWEYAARAGTDYVYSGSDGVGSVSWYHTNSNNETHPAGLKDSNDWGLYDMSGNVYEWILDWYGDYPATGWAQLDPEGAVGGEGRVVRGGSWGQDRSFLRVSHRNGVLPTMSDPGIGLRLVRTANP